jgi:hypothetical protein
LEVLTYLLGLRLLIIGRARPFQVSSTLPTDIAAAFFPS